MFNCDNGAIMRLTTGNTWSQYRDIPSSRWPTPGFCGAMSMAGTATMLMLEPADGYAAEIAMFGGFQRGRRKHGCCIGSGDTDIRVMLHRTFFDESACIRAGDYAALPWPCSVTACVLVLRTAFSYTAITHHMFAAAAAAVNLQANATATTRPTATRTGSG
jgi:hypothetical protein